MKLRDMMFVALLAAVICVCAPLSLPVGPVSMTLATFAVYVAAGVCNYKIGTLATLLYIVLGAVGLPVFSGFSGGFGHLVGPTGGYLLGYVLCALLIGLMLDKIKWTPRFLIPLSLLCGTVLCYTFGTLWFMYTMHMGLVASLLVCVVPFLLTDAIKIIVASLLIARLRPLLKSTYNV